MPKNATVKRASRAGRHVPPPGDAKAAREGRPARSARAAATPAQPGYPASESIGLLMRTVLSAMRVSFTTRLTRYAVPWSSWFLLRVLWEEDGLTQSELTLRAGVMQPNTVTAVRSMREQGLVTVESGADDRRTTRVWLTPRAHRIMRKLLPELRAAVRSFPLRGFTPAEEAELRRLLNKMCANVRGKSDMPSRIGQPTRVRNRTVMAGRLRR